MGKTSIFISAINTCPRGIYFPTKTQGQEANS